jgi:hypothetical protein
MGFPPVCIKIAGISGDGANIAVNNWLGRDELMACHNHNHH